MMLQKNVSVCYTVLNDNSEFMGIIYLTHTKTSVELHVKLKGAVIDLISHYIV